MSRQVPHDLVPDRLFRADLALIEPGVVQILQRIGHNRPASDSARIQGMTSSSI